MPGVLSDNVDELGAEMATLASLLDVLVLAGAGKEVSEDQAHLAAGDVVAATETQGENILVEMATLKIHKGNMFQDLFKKCVLEGVAIDISG